LRTEWPETILCVYLLKYPVAVEKLEISEIRRIVGDRKCRAEQRKVVVGHPDAIFFLRLSPR
jgi:hypothetical protein